MEYSFTTESHKETVNAGKNLGKVVDTGCVVGLIGDLGAGKTCFVKGVVNGLNDVPITEVTSPTFTILQAYEGDIPLYHFDAYRLEGVDDLGDIGFEDYVYGQGVSVIEWADKIREIIPEEYLEVKFIYGEGNERVLEFNGIGRKFQKIVQNL